MGGTPCFFQSALDQLTAPSNMSLSPPAYLSNLQNNIRARPIPWDGAVRAGNLTDEQLKKIRSVDKVRKEQRKQTIEKDVKSYSALLVGGADGPSVLEKPPNEAALSNISWSWRR